MVTKRSKSVAQTGPRSVRGKANSSRNAQTHGLLSQHLIIAGEDRGQFDSLLTTLQTEMRPLGLLENSLVERIAVALWRQRRLIRAESAGIALRAHEKNGPVVADFHNYVEATVSIDAIQTALADDTESQFLSDLLEEIAGFDSQHPNALKMFKKKCPEAYEWLLDDVDGNAESIEDYLADNDTDLEGYLARLRYKIEPALALKQTVAAFRDSRSLPANPETLVRYQSGLDNELYKAMRALREAQSWRLKTLDQIAEAE